MLQCIDVPLIRQPQFKPHRVLCGTKWPAGNNMQAVYPRHCCIWCCISSSSTTMLPSMLLELKHHSFHWRNQVLHAPFILLFSYFDVAPYQLLKRRLWKHGHYNSLIMVAGHKRNDTKTFCKGRFQVNLNHRTKKHDIWRWFWGACCQFSYFEHDQIRRLGVGNKNEDRNAVS